jgi:CheY-like chemotaxis protein
MIRSFEKEHLGILSPRAALCGRVPIIAVSASLVEESLQEYVDTGFDAWILKPISFPRLGELMTAIVDFDVRKKCLYQPGGTVAGSTVTRRPSRQSMQLQMPRIVLLVLLAMKRVMTAPRL